MITHKAIIGELPCNANGHQYMVETPDHNQPVMWMPAGSRGAPQNVELGEEGVIEYRSTLKSGLWFWASTKDGK